MNLVHNILSPSGKPWVIHPSGQQPVNYTYDPVGNVTQVTSSCPWLNIQSFMETFTYNASAQLTAATEMQNQSYSLSVTYGDWGKINGYDLAQTDLQQNTTQSETQSYTYPATNSIGGSQSLFAPVSRNILKNGQPHSVQAFTFGINGSLRKREEHSPNPCTEYYLFNSAANLKAYSYDALDFAYYGYNASNTRAYKLSMLNTNQWVNGEPQPLNLQPQSAMFYPNAYLNFNQNGEYTKHYYNGTERIASRLGDMTAYIYAEAGERLENRIMRQDALFRSQIGELVSYEEPEQPAILGNRSGGTRELVSPPVEYEPFLSIPSLQPTGTPNDIFYYHTNHLGSTAFVTDQNQNITQGFLYAPFGEITTEFDANFGNGTLPKYSFNAKELDEETGMYYYEARYYKPPVFTSRDPMFEKYFWMTPYAYCANNPVKYVDPDGKKVVITGDDGETVDAAFFEMSSRSENLKFTKDDNGVISVSGEAKTREEKYMKKIIEDEKITVHLYASKKGETTDTETGYDIGAFMGNIISYNEKGKVRRIDAYQKYNVKRGNSISSKIGRKGLFIWHEIAEGYEGGIISGKWKSAAEPAFENVDNAIYDIAHQKANKYFLGEYTQITFDFSNYNFLNNTQINNRLIFPDKIIMYKLGLQ